MARDTTFLRAPALRLAAALAGLALAFVVMADDQCGGYDCTKPPVEVGGLVTAAQAAADPCAGKPVEHILAWYTQGGVRYPLRCGRHNPRGYGYLHIRDDGDGGHGDALNDAAFSAEIAYTLEHGVQGGPSGGTWRYSVEYSDAGKACTSAWGFRVVLAKQPMLADGHPTGIITALRYSSRPTSYP
jgi:hypothetical protein